MSQSNQFWYEYRHMPDGTKKLTGHAVFGTVDDFGTAERLYGKLPGLMDGIIAWPSEWYGQPYGGVRVFGDNEIQYEKMMPHTGTSIPVTFSVIRGEVFDGPVSIVAEGYMHRCTNHLSG